MNITTSDLFEKITESNYNIGIAMASGYIVLDSVVTSAYLTEDDKLELYYRGDNVLVITDDNAIFEVEEAIVYEPNRDYLWCYDVEDSYGDIICSVYAFLDK